MTRKEGRKLPAYPVLTSCATFFILMLLFRLSMPLTFQYFLSYVDMIVHMVSDDDVRHINAKALVAQTEWRLHQMELLYNKDWCQKHDHGNEKVAWLTAMNNDNFAIGAIVLGYLIQKLSCHKDMIALVSSDVSKVSRDALSTVGYDVRVTEALDCNWMDKLKGREPRNQGLPGTHMRFHAWNFTEYSAIIYADADVMPFVDIDELFYLEGEFAAVYGGRPGVLDPSFNAGLIVFRPSLKHYNEIMKMWTDLSNTSCPNDQILLWHYYADNGRWMPLPYAYNVRREIYHPMKVYHFACCLTPKPWKVKTIPLRKDVMTLNGPFDKPWDMVLIWWKYFYAALDDYKLHEWWQQMEHIR